MLEICSPVDGSFTINHICAKSSVGVKMKQTCKYLTSSFSENKYSIKPHIQNHKIWKDLKSFSFSLSLSLCPWG
jgi:hypothetical protein